MNKEKLLISSTYAAIITIVFVTFITIWGELAAPVKDWLVNFSGHHWTSKSILSVLLYAVATIVLYLIPQKNAPARLHKALVVLLLLTVLGGTGLALFFTQHHFSAPSSTIKQSTTINSNSTIPSGSTCGGIAGIICPTGYSCEYLDGATYPDAAGQCVPNDR